MIAAVQTSINDVSLYSRVATHRTDVAKELAELKDDVIDRYDAYSGGSGLCAKAAWSPRDTKILQDNWDSLSTVAFGDVRPAVFGSTGKLCFLCGRKAGEIDHYLPRESFPEYSILTLNLLPACRYCNNKKRTRYKKNEEHLYFHPYFMKLPAEQFLTVDLTLDSTVALKFDVDRTSHGEVFDILRRQFDDLSLGDRYRDEAIDYMVEQLNAYHSYLNTSGTSALKSYLQVDANSVAGARGRNHWRAVLLQALADNDEFCSGGFAVLGPAM